MKYCVLFFLSEQNDIALMNSARSAVLADSPRSMKICNTSMPSRNAYSAQSRFCDSRLVPSTCSRDDTRQYIIPFFDSPFCILIILPYSCLRVQIPQGYFWNRVYFQRRIRALIQPRNIGDYVFLLTLRRKLLQALVPILSVFQD